MTKVNFFPKRQDLCIVYSSEAIHSKLFKNLYIQISPKNSLAFRLLKSKPLLLISSFFKRHIDTPVNDGSYIGLLKPNKHILFELKDNEPIAVWKKIKSFPWEKNDFLGYQLISEYTLTEFNRKHELIRKALQTHLNNINENPANIHGDLTHFNILYNANEELFFIDKKSTKHSKLFDFFYFYAYFIQCISRCSTLPEADKLIITNSLKAIIKDVCKCAFERKPKEDHLNLPEVHGLGNIDSLKKDFISIWGDD